MGRMAIEGDGIIPESALSGSLGRTLLAALAVHRGPLARPALADMLWDSHPPDSYERSLNPLLSKLRSAVSEVGGSRHLITSGPGVVELRRTAAVWVDVESATTSLDAAEGALRQGEYRRAWTGAAVASSIFGRPFLPGVDGRWIEERRRLHRASLVRSFEVVVDAWAGLEDPHQMVVAAERLVSADPLRETSHARLIRAHIAEGNPAAAVRAYGDCASLLRDQLGVMPSRVVQNVYEEALNADAET